MHQRKHKNTKPSPLKPHCDTTKKRKSAAHQNHVPDVDRHTHQDHVEHMGLNAECGKVNHLAKNSKMKSVWDDLVEQHLEVFQGLGQFPDEHHIYIDPRITPVVHGCRKILLAIMDAGSVNADWCYCTCHRANKMGQKSGDNRKIKPSSLRLCLVPRELNRAIRRQHYSIPTPEDVQSKLAGNKLFTILFNFSSEKDGYWQIKLDTASSLLCTFNTPLGS